MTSGRTHQGCLTPGSEFLTWASKPWSLSSLRSICLEKRSNTLLRVQPVQPLESPSCRHPSKGSCSEQAERAQQWTGDAQGCLGVREARRGRCVVGRGRAEISKQILPLLRWNKEAICSQKLLPRPSIPSASHLLLSTLQIAIPSLLQNFKTTAC